MWGFTAVRPVVPLVDVWKSEEKKFMEDKESLKEE